MYGVGPQVYAQFYQKLQDIKDYHKRHPNVEVGRPEADIIVKEFETNHNLESQFTGEEAFGLYIDMNGLFQEYINLKGASQDIDYVEYLTKFYLFEDTVDKTTKEYLKYLEEVLEYLTSFFKRTQPLFDLEGTLNRCTEEFENQWNNKSFVPIGSSISNSMEQESSMDDDVLPKKRFDNGAEKLLPWNFNFNDYFCQYCNKKFSKDTVFNAHINSSKHAKVAKRYEEHIHNVFLCEVKVNQLGSLLTNTIESTKEYLQNRQARLLDEGASELIGEEVPQDDDDEDEVVEVKMSKLHYPVGWDGQPIPYWLYRLYGLGQEFKCEICGNTSYWGRRAFEKHFTEWRHAHGMKCLGIENTKEFFEITKIKDAQELAAKLAQDKKRKWNPETMEEFEDPEGYVVDKETYDLLTKNV